MTDETTAHCLAHEIAQLFGGNGLSTDQARESVEDRIRILVDHRRDLIKDKRDLMAENQECRKVYQIAKETLDDRNRTIVFLASQLSRAMSKNIELP